MQGCHASNTADKDGALHIRCSRTQKISTGLALISVVVRFDGLCSEKAVMIRAYSNFSGSSSLHDVDGRKFDVE